jgi:hypothetical protein
MIQVGYDPAPKEFVAQWVVPKEREYQKMTGAGECFGQICLLAAYARRRSRIQERASTSQSEGGIRSADS